ncbi:hypothetical protein [Paraoerskovia marina]|uniref:hypothetical protein n=1 Tax=Paraoerskovia marina TaxID=545619 RepID=UPI000492C8B8|nr:hypothetical protein [Paraoerskovia marina]
MTRRIRAGAWAGAALLAILVSLLLARTVAPTEAAWVDAAVVSSSASAGTWNSGGGGDGPFTPGNADTVITDVGWTVSSATQFCADVEIATDSTDEVAWAMDVDTAAAPFNSSFPDELQGAVGPGGASPGDVVTVTGTDGGEGAPFDEMWNNALISAGQTATVHVCDYAAGLPSVVDPGDDTYTYTTALAGSSPYNVCAVTTVEGHSDPFYVGWEVVLDWSDTLDAQVAAGQITQAQADDLASVDLTRWDASGAVDVTQEGDVYTVHGATAENAAVVDGQSLTVKGCAS